MDIQVLGVCGGGNVVGPSTQIFYICQQYSLVFVVDMSPNMRAVVCTLSTVMYVCIAHITICLQSNSSYCVKLDQAVSCLCSCLTLLTQPVSELASPIYAVILCCDPISHAVILCCDPML